MCRLFWHLGASTFCKPQGLYRDCFTFTFTLLRIMTLSTVPRGLWVPPQSSIQWILGVFFLAMNRLVYEPDNLYFILYPYWDLWSYIPRPLYLYVVIIKHTNDLTFIFTLSAYFLEHAYLFSKCGPVLMFRIFSLVLVSRFVDALCWRLCIIFSLA